MATVPIAAGTAALIMAGTDLLIKLMVYYNSLPDAEPEAKARYEAMLPLFQGELAWLAAYVPRTPR